MSYPSPMSLPDSSAGVPQGARDRPSFIRFRNPRSSRPAVSDQQSPAKGCEGSRGFATERASFAIDDRTVPILQSIMFRIKKLGYSEAGIRQRLGLQDLADLQWRALPMYRSERLTTRDKLALSIELFLLQGALTKNEVGQLLDPSERDVFIKGWSALYR